MDASTFPALLAHLLGGNASRPLVTFYDDATGERVELSVATYANWVSKTAGLLRDELDAEHGGLVVVDLPVHWLGAVWLGAAWSAGLCVTDDPADAADAAVVVCGPDGVGRHAVGAADRPVVALSLRPLGGRFLETLPSGVVDYGAVVLAQPDVFLADEPVRPTDQAWRDSGGVVTQSELVSTMAGASAVSPGGRLLTDVNPCSREGLPGLLAPLSHGVSAVWVANPAEGRWGARYEQERATAQLRGTRSSRGGSTHGQPTRS